MVEKDMDTKMNQALSGLNINSEDASSLKGSNNSSILHFCTAFWELLGPDVDNIITAVSAISLKVQAQEGPEEHWQIKQINDSFVTPKVWDSLRNSRGETPQKQFEYLSELEDK